MVVPLIAVALDVSLGEPPARFHPVVAMGRYLTWGRARFAGRGVLAGAIVLAIGIAVVAAAAGLLAWLVRPLPGGWEAVALALLLKPLLSLRPLLAAAEEVRGMLAAGALPEARMSVTRHLVSRDTGNLGTSDIAGASISSLAENLTDSVVAPLFYYALFGLPGAAVYRFCNTADAVLGYRTPDLERLGRSAARVDDLLNLLPARLSALLLLAAAAVTGRNWRRGARVAWSDAHRTPSPNGGWTMAGIAGILGVRLEKRDAYVLNFRGRSPACDDIRHAQWLVALSSAVLLLMMSFWQHA